MLPMPSSLRLQVLKPKCMPPIDSTLSYANMFHQQNVCSASFDLMHDLWPWERTLPRGVIVLNDSPLDFSAHFVQDAPEELDHEQTQAQSPRALVLQYLEGTRSLPQFAAASSSSAAASGAAATAGHGSPSCGHTDVLIPAPDHLLWSPSHPLYPMEPALWIPFAAVENVDHFITPYHRGLFGTRYPLGDVGPVELIAAPRDPLFTPRASGPFTSAVYYGSVVSYSGPDEKEMQGVVVLTYVKQHRRQGREWLRQMVVEGLRLREGPPGSAAVVPAAVTSAINAMPECGPLPLLAIWPLQKPSDSSASSAAAATCWQELAPEGSKLHYVRSSEVTHVWDATGLGALGALKGKRVANLEHRTSPESQPLQLDNPAQPTQLRVALSQLHIQRAVEAFVSSSVMLPNSENAGRDFLRAIRQRAQGGFPVSELLTARAVINCAQPLPLPGLFSTPKLTSAASSSAAAPSKKPAGASRTAPSRKSATAGQQQAAKQARAEAEEEESKPAAATPVASRKKAQAPRSSGSKRKSAATPAASAVAASSAQSSTALSPALQSRAKALFLELSDPLQPENVAPLSGTVWDSWTTDRSKEAPYDPTLGGHALSVVLGAWQNVLWDQLQGLDEQFYHFLLDQTKSKATVEQLVAALGERGGCSVSKGAEWRRNYKSWKGPGKNVLLWHYTKGVQPAAEHGSIWSMHCKNVWHGTCYGVPYKIVDFSSEPAAAASSTPKSRSSSRKSKRLSTSSVTTANKDSVEKEEGEQSDSEDESEVPPTVIETPAVGSGRKSKRQKPTPTSTVTATHILSPTHAAAAATPTIAATLPATSEPRIPTPVAAAAASSSAAAQLGSASPAQAEPGTSPAALITTPTVTTSAAAAPSATAVIQPQAGELTTVVNLFLAHQARSEERAEAAQRHATEATKEMMRMTQDTVSELVR